MKEKMLKRLLVTGFVCLVLVIVVNLLLLHCFDYRINMIEDLLFIVVMIGWDQYDYWRKKRTIWSGKGLALPSAREQ